MKTSRDFWKKTRASLASVGVWLGLMLLTAPGARAQALAWQQAVAGAPVGNSRCQVLATAAGVNGSVYLAGAFAGTVTLGGTTLTSAGRLDGFVARWNPGSGSFAWVQQLGSTADDYVMALAVTGNTVYVGGDFYSATLTLGATTLANLSVSDVFVAKLTDAGTSVGVEWAQRAGGIGGDNLFKLAVSGTAVYVAGFFDGRSMAFGSTQLFNNGVGTADGFVARLTDGGSSASWAWAQGMGGSGFDYLNSVVAIGTTVYVAGYFQSPRAYMGTAVLTNASSAGLTNDTFVAKLTDLSSSASLNWAERAGAATDDYATALAVGTAGVYLTGSFVGSMAFGGLASLNSAGVLDVYVAKLTDSGSRVAFTWALQAGGSDYDNSQALAVSGATVYVAGYFQSQTAVFGPTTLTNYSNGGIKDIFVAKLLDAGPSGSWLTAVQAGGGGNDTAQSLALVGNALYVGGTFTGPAGQFGPVLLAAPASASAGFVAVLADGMLRTAVPASTGICLETFPNPAQGKVIVRLRLPVSATEKAPTTDFTLLDALGRPLRQQTTPPAAAGKDIAFDLTGIAPGVYALHVQAGTYAATQKLVVE